MSFKFLVTQVISEPKFSMMINRTLQPSYHSLKNHTIGRKLAPTTKSLCCYSLALSGQQAAQLARNYSGHSFSDSRSSKKGGYSYSARPGSDIVNAYLKSLSGQARKTGGSLKKFEPCYRPMYPSKKNPKPTYTIPRKLPYIPAVFQPRRKPFVSHKQKKPCPQKHPVLNQWPTLYKCKRRDAEQKPTVTRPKTGDLPPWLLPLYSCKAGRPDDLARLSEARFSGGAFHRKMAVLEGISEIRQKQKALSSRLNEDINKKAVNNYKPQPFVSKNAAAVNNLKRMIGENYAKRSMKRFESFQRRQQIMKESESVENPSEAMLDDKTKTHSPSSSNQGVMGKVTSYSPKKLTNLKEVDPSMEHSSQFSSEIQGVYKSSSESKTVPSLSRMESSNGPRKLGGKDQTLINKENNGTDINEWSVQSLKSRINDMLANEGEKLNKITSNYNELVGAKKYSSDGLRPKGNQPSRSFHRCSLKPTESKLNEVNTSTRGIATSSSCAHSINGGLQLQRNSSGSHIGKRCMSSFSLIKGVEQPRTTILSSYRTHNYEKELPVKKTKWITRFKRCFVIKKDKGHKVDDWKHTPRKIPYLRKLEDTSYSPSPVLWTPKGNAESQPESPVERTNPVVLNAEQRIKASINRIVPTPVQKLRKVAAECAINPVILDADDKLKVGSINPSDGIPLAQQEALDRLIQVEKKVRKAELKVSILPLPWPNEVKSTEKTSKLPEFTSSQNDNLSGIVTGLGKKEETGYEWIMNNKQIVEDIKYRSRQIAGKPLVPSHVKQSIEEFKLPLKAQIAQYRKSIERKAHGLYFYSTSKRWYSTSCSTPCYSNVLFHGGSQAKFLQRLNMVGISARNLSCDASQSNELQSQRDQSTQNSSSEVPIGSEFYHKYALRPMYGDFSRDEPLNRLTKNPKYTKSWTNVTEKALQPRPVGRLTSPNKMLHKVGDTSPAALKKQVQDLKRLIRKSKGLDCLPEKVEDVLEPPQSSDSYELKLRKLIRAAQVNAKKVKVVEPKYQTENNLLHSTPGVERKSIIPPKVEPIKFRLDNSFTPNFFTNQGNDSRIDRSSLKTKPQIYRAASVDSFPKKKTPLSNMYLKLKSFVESVRRKSTHETPSPVRKIPNDKLRGSVSACSLPNLGKIKNDVKVPAVVSEAKEIVANNNPLMVELRGGHAVTPASSVQLWKVEPPDESDVSAPAVVEDTKTVLGDEMSKPVDLVSLITRAKELLNIQSELNAQEYAKFSKIIDSKTTLLPDTEVKNAPFHVGTIDESAKRILSPEEIMQSLLTKHEPFKITESKMEQIDAKLSQSKTKFWPVMSFLPQNVFGNMDEVVGKKESSTHPVFHQDNEISSGDGQSSSVQPSDCPKTRDDDSGVRNSSVQCLHETPKIKTCSIHEKPEETSETHIVSVSVYHKSEEANPVRPSSETTTPFTSQASDSVLLSDASTAPSCIDQEKGLAKEDRSEVINEHLKCDSKVLVAENNDQTAQESCCESFFHSGQRKDQDLFSQEGRIEAAGDASTFESAHLGRSDPNGVSPERWKSFSKNLRNVLARNTVEFNRTEQNLPESLKEMATCDGSGENVGSSPQLVQNNGSSTANNYELEHGMANFEHQYYSYLDSDFQKSHSSSPYEHNHEIVDCSKVICSTPNDLTNDVDFVIAEETEQHIDTVSINDISCHECQKLAELLAKDPTIDPESVKKLKLPELFSEDCKEKSWCTPPRNE